MHAAQRHLTACQGLHVPALRHPPAGSVQFRKVMGVCSLMRQALHHVTYSRYNLSGCGTCCPRLLDAALLLAQVLARGERIDRLMDQSEGLRNSADRFHRVGQALRRKMWWQNKKMWLIAIVILLVLIFIIFLSVCFSGGNCFKQ